MLDPGNGGRSRVARVERVQSGHAAMYTCPGVAVGVGAQPPTGSGGIHVPLSRQRDGVTERRRRPRPPAPEWVERS